MQSWTVIFTEQDPANFSWRKWEPAFESRKAASNKCFELCGQGYAAYYAKTKMWDAIGLPETLYPEDELT